LEDGTCFCPRSLAVFSTLPWWTGVSKLWALPRKSWHLQNNYLITVNNTKIYSTIITIIITTTTTKTTTTTTTTTTVICYIFKQNITKAWPYFRLCNIIKPVTPINSLQTENPEGNITHRSECYAITMSNRNTNGAMKALNTYKTSKNPHCVFKLTRPRWGSTSPTT
jgi:hypothetical protein